MALSLAAATLAGAGIGAGSSIAGGLISNNANKKMAKKNYKLQKDLAYKGIQIRTADAKKAGIHPLFALGASTPTASPISVGDSLGPSIANAGQEISRGISAHQSKDRQSAQDKMALLQLMHQGKESDARVLLIQSEIALNEQKLRQGVSGPAEQLGVMGEGTLANTMHDYFTNRGARRLTPNDRLKMTMPTGNDQPNLAGAGTIEKKAAIQWTHMLGNRGIVAGTDHPSFKQYMLPDGTPMLMPEAATFGEGLEQVPSYLWPSVWKLNKRMYGQEWATRIKRRYMPYYKESADALKMDFNAFKKGLKWANKNIGEYLYPE